MRDLEIANPCKACHGAGGEDDVAVTESGRLQRIWRLCPPCNGTGVDPEAEVSDG